MPNFARLLLGAWLAAGSTHALAIDVERAEARFADNRYSFELIATLDAPIDRVEAVLKDYAGYRLLDDRILESRVLERLAPDQVKLFTSLRACFGPFCRSVKRVELVQERGYDLRATTIPDQSDISYGDTHTQIGEAGGRTRVVYRTTVAPAFWIPRFVGRRLMLSTLRDASLSLFGNVEARARDSAEPKEAPKEAPKDVYE